MGTQEPISPTQKQINQVEASQTSTKWHLSQQDIISWAKWTLAFFSPSIIILLTAIQQNTDWKTAETMALNTVVVSLIYLFKKLQDS
jgi:hypothetical protein